MNPTLAQVRITEPKEMRNVYCATLMKIAESNKNIVALDADLMNSMGMMKFAQKYPETDF